MPEGNEIPERFGRYQVLEELGSGAMGIVYLCVDPSLNRPVAVKVLRESEQLPPEERERYEERFRREAEAAGGLHHPDIVRVYDVGPSWLVMEFIEGQTLSVYLRSARLTVGQTSALVGRVADALDYAHRHGIVHRDVKPANIMITEDGGVKVMDFGVARLESSNLTALGTVVGSVRYMAPEQMMGERVDGRADIFSLGAVAYELFTGRPPFPGKTITEVVSRVVHGSHVPPRQVDERLPEGLNAVFARVFAPKAADRYGRASDFARDLLVAAQPVLDLEVATPAIETPNTDPMGAPPATIHYAPSPGDTAFLGHGSRIREGVLLLESEPPGARAYVDETLVGITPVESVEVGFGRHLVRMELPGRLSATAELEVTALRPLQLVSLTLAEVRHPAALSPGQFVDFGLEVLPPRRIAGSSPAYPAAARELGLGGASVVDVWIGGNGEVVATAVAESAGELLDAALLAAVNSWRFAPATLRGVPVSVRLTVRHEFQR
jgi:TonB family protein